jgi:hypothetical protein
VVCGGNLARTLPAIVAKDVSGARTDGAGRRCGMHTASQIFQVALAPGTFRPFAFLF